MHFIEQYIRESQVKYPSISSNPKYVLNHLLFVNGNGVEIMDGNFVEFGSYYRPITFSEYYRFERSTDECIEIEDRFNFDKEVDDIKKRLKEFSDMYKKIVDDTDVSDETRAKFADKIIENEDDLWEKAVDKYNARYDDVDFIDNYTLDQLKDENVMYDMIMQSKYNPHVGLSSEYYKAYYFDERTDKDLVEITIALSKAYMKRMKILLEDKNEFDAKPSPLGNGEHKWLRDSYRKDIKTFKELIERLEGYLV